MFFNEIVLCTMKSSQARMKSSAFASDEMKSASPIPTKSDFIAKRFHPTQVGFLPPSADLVEKSTHCLGRQMCAFFWRRRRDRNRKAKPFFTPLENIVVSVREAGSRPKLLVFSLILTANSVDMSASLFSAIFITSFIHCITKPIKSQ